MTPEAAPIVAEVEKLEEEMVAQLKRLAELKRRLPREEVHDYVLQGWDGPVRLSELFGTKKDLIVIHNMGTGCRYCTLWADGFNGVRRHLEDRAGFVVVSPDKADAQRAFAQGRGWGFRMASGQGSTFIEDMGFRGEKSWKPGLSTFVKEGETIYRVAKASFGPYDPYCGVWHLIALLGDGENGWEPQYRYDA